MVVLLIPAVIGVHIVLPGTIGSLRASFFPEGGLVAEQSTNPGWRGSGRLADVAAGRAEPDLVVTGARPNFMKVAPILRAMRDYGVYLKCDRLLACQKPLAETLDVVKHSSSYLDRPVLVTIKKSKDTRVFNPIVLKQLFAALKPFPGFLHILLTNEHDEFVGYIPAWRARTDFTGTNAETKIREYIVDVLADPSTSTKLRDIGGLAMEDWISDGDTVAAAARKTSEGLLRGLVICKSGRKRKPYGVIFTEELYKLAAYGA